MNSQERNLHSEASTPEQALKDRMKSKTSKLAAQIREFEAQNKPIPPRLVKEAQDLLMGSVLKYATKADYERGTVFTGYLYNVDMMKWVRRKVDSGWIYDNWFMVADKDLIADAIMFDMLRDSVNQLILRINVSNKTYYVSYRNGTGVCKFMDDYVSLTAKWETQQTFQFYYTPEKQNCGRLDNTKYLYLRDMTKNTRFQFLYYNAEELSQDESALISLVLHPDTDTES